MSDSVRSLGSQVDATYRAVTGRAVDEDTLRYWTSMISGGQRSLSDVRSYLATTQGAADGIQAAYQSDFGRGASTSEVADRRADLGNGASLSDLHASLAHSAGAADGISNLYQQVLGRGASASEIADRETDLAGGASLGDLRTSLAQSGEAAGDIRSLFTADMGRPAQAGDLAFWQGHLAADTSMAGIRQAFAGSADAGKQIGAIYQSVLGRPPTASELSDRRADLGGGAAMSDLRTALAHSAPAADAVGGLYQQVLGRAASASEVADRQADLTKGAGLDDLRTSLAQSGEAAGDIRSLFTAELGRPAQQGDLQFWQGHLAADASLAGVRQAFAGSDDAAGQIQAAYQSVLGRAASASELADRRADLAGGAGLGGVRQSLTRTDGAVAGIQALYVQVLGRRGSDGEVSSRQADLAGRQSMAGLGGSVASTGEAASDIQGVFQRVAGRAADAKEVAAWQGTLGGGTGWTLAQVGPAVATSEVNRFYQDLFGRDATAGEQAGFRASLAAGEALSSQFARLRPVFATSASETGTIQGFYAQTFGVDAAKTDISRDVGAIESALAVGQSLRAIEDSLTPDLTRQLKAAYRGDLGREASWPELQFWQDKVQAGLSLPGALAGIARSQESTTHVQALWQQNFGRYAGVLEVQGFQDGEAAPAAADAKYAIATPAAPGAPARALATVDPRTLVGEAAVYIGLSGGVAPTLAGPDGQVRAFRNGYEFSAYALGLASKAGVADAGAWRTGKLTAGWLDQVGQADIQAAVALQGRAAADQAAGRIQDAVLEGMGAQLAAKIQQQAQGERGPQSMSVTLGQFTYDVTVTGDAQDPAGLAGYSAHVTDTDPERTQLVARAQAEAAAGKAAGAAGNQLLAVLDNAEARVDAAYAGLPKGARTDKMLGVARQFVDAGQAAAAAGDWNKVQMLETAADVSLKIAAQPEGERRPMTERYMHKGVKHDVTIDPTLADPYAHLKDHSKGEDVVGAIVEGVAGVVINVLAAVTIETPLALYTVPAAVAWDTAHAAQSFVDGNVLGGLLGLGQAVGVGLGGLGGFAQAAQAAGLTDVAAAAGGALRFTDGLAGALGFTAIPGVAATATAPAVAAVSATSQLGATVLSGVALVGGAQGIAQSAGRGDALGIAAGALEIAAAVAGGLVSTKALAEHPELARIAAAVRTYGTYAATAAGAADAFKNGDLASGLQASLNALLPLLAQEVGSRMGAGPQGTAGGSNQTGASGATPTPVETAPLLPVTQEDLPPLPGYGEDGRPLPVPPIPPEYGAAGGADGAYVLPPGTEGIPRSQLEQPLSAPVPSLTPDQLAALPDDVRSRYLAAEQYSSALKRIGETSSAALYSLSAPGLSAGQSYRADFYELMYRIATAEPADLPQINRDIQDLYMRPAASGGGDANLGTRLIGLAADAADAGSGTQGLSYRQGILDDIARYAVAGPASVPVQIVKGIAGGIASVGAGIAQGTWGLTKAGVNYLLDATSAAAASDPGLVLDDATAQQMRAAAQQDLEQAGKVAGAVGDAALATLKDPKGAVENLYRLYKSAEAQAARDGTLPEFYSKFATRVVVEGGTAALTVLDVARGLGVIGKAANVGSLGADAAAASQATRTGIKAIEGLNPVAPTVLSGNLSASKIAGNGVSVLATDAADQALVQQIKLGGQGKLTETLVSSVARREGLTELPGGKYGSDNGFDHVLMDPNGTVTILLDSKQIVNGATSLDVGAGGAQQLTDT